MASYIVSLRTAAIRPMSMGRAICIGSQRQQKRTKVTLPDLPYDYGALEPYISGTIMKIHHDGHHKAYVNGLNTATEKFATAEEKNEIRVQNELLPLLNFNGGGHINHSLFWENLAPAKQGGGERPGASTALGQAIDKQFGSIDNLVGAFNTKLAGIQGSGWAWLAYNNTSKNLEVITRANQDPVVGQYSPLLGIDAWEHAYYLQYQNKKADYFKAIWNVINWKTVADRYGATTGK